MLLFTLRKCKQDIQKKLWEKLKKHIFIQYEKEGAPIFFAKDNQ